MSKILVCPIAFNENTKIRNTIERFLESPVRTRVDYLVVDDGSTDSTSPIIQNYGLKGIKTIKHEYRRGVGKAIRTAIDYARESGYEILVSMAGNNKDNPDEIERLIEPILKEGYDFVQGSRYQEKGAAGGDMPLYRKIATRLHAFFMSWLTGRSVTDSTNGFRAFRLSLFDDARININQE